MKAIVITSTGQQFGPFASVETLSDRYRAGGVEFQFNVIGEATIEDYVAPPVVISPEQVKQNAIDVYNATLKALEDAYPQKERDTWPQQIIEARAYLTDSLSSTPLIDAMLTKKVGVTKSDLVNKIMTNYTVRNIAA